VTGWMRKSIWLPATLLLAGLIIGVLGEAGVIQMLRVSQGISIMKYIGLSLSMAVIMSYAGYVSFGHSLFIGLGGYAASYIVVGLHKSEIMRYMATQGALPRGFVVTMVAESALLAIALSVLVAVVIGLPVLRLRGAFFAIATIGLNYVALYIVKVLLRGITEYGDEVPFPNMGLSTMNFFWIYYAFFIITVIIAYLARITRFGFGLAAIREDEDAAEVMGVDTLKYKVIAFSIAGSLASLWGVADAFSTSYTADVYFSLGHSIVMILENAIGGLGTFSGPVVGALIYYPLNWYTQTMAAQLALAIMGALIVIVIDFFPSGVVGLIRDKLPRLRPYLE
jgi:branched-chain amino acid transport system permease protein